MTKNIGYKDKAMRLALAALIIILYFTKVISGTLAIVLFVVAALLVLTSMINFCPLYSILGTNTCDKK